MTRACEAARRTRGSRGATELDVRGELDPLVAEHARVRGWAGNTTGSSSRPRPPTIRRASLAGRSPRDGPSRRHTPPARAVEPRAGGDRCEAKGGVRHHVPDDERLPGTPSAASVSTDRSSGQSRSTRKPVDLDPRALLRHRQVAAAEARLDVRDRDAVRAAARAPARVEFVSPRTSTASGRSAATTPWMGAVSVVDVGGPEVEAMAGSGRPSSSKKTCDSSSSQCCPVWTTTSSIPASRSATESGADLTNCGRLPTTVRMLHRRQPSCRNDASRPILDR